MIVRWMVEANMSYQSPILNKSIRLNYFCAFAFGVWPTLVVRIYKVVTESIFILFRIPYHMHLAHVYDLDNERNPNKPPNTVTEIDRLWHKVGHEWVDLWESLHCWGICLISFISPGSLVDKINEIRDYYLTRIDDDSCDSSYVANKILIGGQNAELRKIWKETRKLPKELLADNISVPGVRAPEDIYKGFPA